MMGKVIQLIKDAGYTQCALGVTTHGGKVSRIAGNRFVGTHTTTRPKFMKDDKRVTVGKRTTCFYRIENRQAVDFVNFDTKDYDAIVAFVKGLED